MVWFKVDDTFHSHPKQMAASLAAVGLWSVAGSWSSNHLTDGFVPDHVIPSLSRGAPELAKELCAAGLWRRVRGGYQFHQWNADGDGQARNPTRSEAMNGRNKMASGGSLGNHRRWHVGKGRVDASCRYCQDKPDRPPDRLPDRVPDDLPESPPSRPGPVPSRRDGGSLSDHSAGDQSVRAGARTREAARWLNQRYGLTDDESAQVIAEVRRRAGEIRAGLVAYMSGRMTENGTLADIVGAVQTAADQRRDQSEQPSQPLVVVPDWCGRCHERTRMVEVGDDRRPRHCPDCHPSARREAS
jgi:hypothetical protein